MINTGIYHGCGSFKKMIIYCLVVYIYIIIIVTMSHIREPYLKLTYLSGDPVRESSIAGDLVHPHCIRQFNKLILEDDL
jgi:hypothetical protein